MLGRVFSLDCSLDRFPGSHDIMLSGEYAKYHLAISSTVGDNGV